MGRLRRVCSVVVERKALRGFGAKKPAKCGFLSGYGEHRFRRGRTGVSYGRRSPNGQTLPMVGVASKLRWSWLIPKWPDIVKRNVGGRE
jgi:hypothetical protein